MSKTQSSVLKIVEDDVKRLVRFTDSMINISEMELSPTVLNIDQVEACGLLQSAIDKNKKMYDLKEIKINFRPARKKVLINGDREKLSEVFSSILSNSIKFNKPKGSVYITFSTTKKSGSGFLQITVRDTGIGIDPAELKVLFDKEKKVDARLRKKGGEFGLSMAIAKMVIELHGGKIDVRSIQGKSTTFTVTLPFNSEG